MDENRTFDSQGHKSGPKVMDRFTFWQNGIGRGKYNHCPKCGCAAKESKQKNDGKWYCIYHDCECEERER